MRRLLKVFFVSTFIFSFSIVGNAQSIGNYLFLETFDSQGSGVSDVEISTPNSSWRDKSSKKEWLKRSMFFNDGKLRVSLGNCCSTYEFAKPAFRVTKSGYYQFIDLGTHIKPFENYYKLELLKIPQTEEESKALGNEQFKREFIWAARDGDTKKIRQLIKSGISPNLNTNDLRGISAPKDVPAIMFAAASGDYKTLEIFLKSDGDVRKFESPEHSLLAYYLKAQPPAFWNQKKNKEESKVMAEFGKGVKSLIERGARLENLDEENSNALMIAARYSSYTGIAKISLKKGLPINAQDKNGKTALYNANPYWNTQMIKLLLESGANPNIISKSSCFSILMQAVHADNIDIVKLLLKHNADVNFSCANGEKAMKYAKREEVKKLLQDAGAK